MVATFRSPWVVLGVSVLALSACPRTPELAILTVTPDNARLARGERVQFVATGLYTDNSTRVLTGDVTWSVDDGFVGTFSADTKGLLEGQNSGETTVRAKLGAVSTSRRVTVSGAGIARLEIDPPQPVVPVGLSLPLKVTAVYTDSTTQDVTALCTWMLPDPTTVMSVAGDSGVITGLGPGSAAVVASFDGASARVTVTVTDASIVSLSLTPYNPQLPIGVAQRLVATAQLSDQSTLDVSEQATWSSSDSQVVFVSSLAGEKGAVVGRATGSATVSAKVGASSASTPVTVSAAQLERIEVTPLLLTLAKGSAGRFTATGFFTDGTHRDLSANATWSVVDASVARVGTSGQVSSLSVGHTRVTVALGSVSSSAQVDVTSASLTSLELAPSPLVLPKGTAADLTVTGRYSDGTAQDLTDQVVFSTSDSAVATVSNAAGRQGHVQASSPGSATITAAGFGQTATLPVTVSAAVLVSLQLEPSRLSLAVGTWQALIATGVFSDGTSAEVTQQVTWSSSDVAVAAVSNVAPNRGLVSVSHLGTATVTASWGPVSVSAEVTVTAAVLRTLALTPRPLTLAAGTSQRLTATGIFTDDTTQDVSGQVTWASSDAGIASVSNAPGAEGVVSALSAGSSVVSARLGSVTGTVAVTVTPATLVDLTVTTASTSIAKGLTQPFTARGRFTDSTTQDLTNQVTWASSAPLVASVSNSNGSRGVLTALSPGPTTVSATLGTVSGGLAVTVTPAVLNSLTVTPPSPSLALGTTVRLSASGTLSDGQVVDLSTQVTWSSSDALTVSVSNGSGTEGRVSALLQGSATISAQLSGKTGSTVVTVTPAVLTGLDVTPAAKTVPLGVGVDFVVTGTYSDLTTQNLTTQATWASSNEAVALVSNASGSQGHASSVSTGFTTITATFGGQVAHVRLDVSAATLASIEVSPASARLAKLTSGRFQATGVYTDGRTEDLSGQVSWSTGDVLVATVDPVTGRATGVGGGVTSVVATQGLVSGSAQLTVTDVSLVSLALSPAMPSSPAGFTKQLSATGTFSDSSTQDLTDQVSWNSSDSSLATVSNAPASPGLVSALKVGTPTVSATALGQTGSTVFTVTSALLVSIGVNPQTASTPKGLTQSFTASGVFTDGSTSDVTTSVTWASSDAAVASVSNASGSNGLATALTLGTTTISASWSGKSSSAVMTVTAAQLVHLDLTPSAPTLPAGVSVSLTATGTYTDATTQNLTANVTWASDSESVASVSNAGGSEGRVTAHAVGTATVTASLAGQVGSTVVTVTPAQLVSIGLSPATPTVPRGLSQALSATGVYTDGSTQDLTAVATWSSTDSTVAPVVPSGLGAGTVTASNTGSATISATSGGKTGSTLFTVSAAVLQSLQVTPSSPSVAAGLHRALTATGVYSDASTQDLTTQVTWSSLDPATASVSNASGSEGDVTGLVAGSTTITAAKGSVQGQVTFTVTPAVLQQIEVTPANTAVPKGLPVQYVATGIFSNSTTQNLTTQVTWSTDDASTVAISNASGSEGRASTLKVGAVTVTAQLGSVSGSTPLTVSPAAMVSLAVTPSGPNLPLGTVRQFTATATYTDASTQVVTALSTWSSSDAAVVDVSNGSSSHGLATTFMIGSADVSASYGGFVGTSHVTVTQATLVAIDLTPPAGSTPLGFTRQFIAIGTYSDATTQVLTNVALWASSDTSKAFISNANGSRGLMSTVATGPVTISATYQGITGTSNHAVSAAVLVGLTVSPASVTVANGGTATLTATGTFSDASTQNVTTSVLWSTQDAAKVQVSNASGSQGVVTGLAVGSTTVTATMGAYSDSASITVQ